MDTMFNNVDFGPLRKYLDDDDITDVSYSNNGQLWLKSLSNGIYKPTTQDVDNSIIEKLAFQCANMMGKTFNMAHPFLDAESAELRLNFVHDSIAKNGIALLMRKTPAKIRLSKEKVLNEKYITENIHDFLIKCVEGHCNIIISGETGSGKTEFLKYLASHTKENEKIIMIEDTLELHLDKIYPGRDIVSMKTNNIASYSEVLVTCMRQNPRWILLSEVRSAEAVMAVRNSISSGHNILSTIHADKAESIPTRMYSLLETDTEIDQFLKTIYRYVQIGVHIRGYQDKETKKFVREVCEVCEFYVDDDNNAKSNVIYKKTPTGQMFMQNPTKYLLGYLEAQGTVLDPHCIVPDGEEGKQDSEKYFSHVENITDNVEEVLETTTVDSTPVSVPAQTVAPAPVVDSVPVQTVAPAPVVDSVPVQAIAPTPVVDSVPVQTVAPTPVVDSVPVQAVAPTPVVDSVPVQAVAPTPVVDSVPVQASELNVIPTMTSNAQDNAQVPIWDTLMMNPSTANSQKINATEMLDI